MIIRPGNGSPSAMNGVVVVVVVVDMCEKFHNDRLRNDRALVV